MDTLDQTTMMKPRQSAVPWWAAFGAPFVGVPLLVLLLALGSPDASEKAELSAGEAVYTTEQVEAAPAAPALPVEAAAAPAPESVSRC